MSDSHAVDAAPTSSAAPERNVQPVRASSPLVWILLALWIAWLAAMIYMSRHEWGKVRPIDAPSDAPVEIPQGALDRNGGPDGR